MNGERGTTNEMQERDFDAQYYRRFYLDRETRVAEPEFYDRLAAFMAGYAGLLGLRVRSILDLGCGIGSLRKPLLRRFPRATYLGVETSAYACEKFGWELASIVDYRSDPVDLVICHDVLQYLPKGDAKSALARFAELTRGALYFSVLTTEDWEENCDQSRTDADVYLRSAQWYRRRLQPFFRNLGGGMYLSRDNETALYALEHLD